MNAGMATGIKHITAGPFHERIMGQIPDLDIAPKRRGARVNPTPPAQAFFNDKRSWMELRLWIFANFESKALVLTLTYTDPFLPPDKKSADKLMMTKFIRRMRRARKRKGKEWKYIYCTEGYHGLATSGFLEEDGTLEDKRIHHHMIVNGIGPEDYDEIRSLWPGGGYVRIEPFDIRYCTQLAKYMTKEAREFGREKPGDRTWKRSMNLTAYQVEYIKIPMNGMTWTPPTGAVDYEVFHDKNPYGFADCVGDRYLLFEAHPNPEYTYTQGPKKKRPPYLN